MPKVLTINNDELSSKPTKTTMRRNSSMDDKNTSIINIDGCPTIDFDDITSTSSILEFLSQEQECCSDADAESIFQQVSRLADNSDTRTVDEILHEAELLIRQQNLMGDNNENESHFNSVHNVKASNKNHPNITKLNEKYTKSIENVRPVLSSQKYVNDNMVLNALPKHVSHGSTQQTENHDDDCFEAFVENLPSESVISEESTPPDMQNSTLKDDETIAQLSKYDAGEDTDDGTDTMEEITEAIETIELVVNERPGLLTNGNLVNFQKNENKKRNGSGNDSGNSSSDRSSITHYDINAIPNKNTFNTSLASSMLLSTTNETRFQPANAQHKTFSTERQSQRRLSCDYRPFDRSFEIQQHHQQKEQKQQKSFNISKLIQRTEQKYNSILNSHPQQPTVLGLSSSQNCIRNDMIKMTDNSPNRQSFQRDNNNMKKTIQENAESRPLLRTYCDKSVNSSQKHFTSTLTSPIESIIPVSREHALKQEIEQLQEHLKDTEERLQSLRIQHDSLSHLHRDLRENNTHLQEESEILKLDVQHLNECANILRAELQTARKDRMEAMNLQKVLQAELEENRQGKKQAQEQKEKDNKTIQDLQRQCREMERILMRKHPDSVSALIVSGSYIESILDNGLMKYFNLSGSN